MTEIKVTISNGSIVTQDEVPVALDFEFKSQQIMGPQSGFMINAGVKTQYIKISVAGNSLSETFNAFSDILRKIDSDLFYHPINSEGYYPSLKFIVWRRKPHFFINDKNEYVFYCRLATVPELEIGSKDC